MDNTTHTRPIWVWIISIFLGCAAISQFTMHTVLLTSPADMQDDRVQSIVNSWTFLDYMAPYILSSILLVAMIQLFRLKSIAYPLFSCYLGFVIFMTIYQAIMTSWLVEFQIQGALSALGGLALMIIVFFYIRNLKTTNILA